MSSSRTYKSQGNKKSDDDDGGGILRRRNVWIAIGLQMLSLVILIIIVAKLADFKAKDAKRMFHWGPSNNGIDVNVFGINVDNALKYGLLMGWIVVSEMESLTSY